MNGQSPQETRGYISSLAPRPHALTPPGPRPSRWVELWAALRWIFRSWVHPADTEAASVQEDA